MEQIDFIELAEYCVKKAKEVSSYVIKHYESTQFVCISKDNSVKCSMTPHILRDEYQCILMHKMRDYNDTWYEFEFINEERCVKASDLDDIFILSSERTKRDKPLIMLKEHWVNEVGVDQYHMLCSSDDICKIWDIYSRIKDVSSKSEWKLIVELFKKDEKILGLEKLTEDFNYTNHLLEQERDQYKDMLDEIKEMIDSKK